MGSAALGAFLSELSDKIILPSIWELVLECRANKHVHRLLSNFTAIKAVLDDAEEQQWTNKKMKDWLGKIKDVAYDVEDIFDDFEAEEYRRRDETERRFMTRVCNFLSRSNPVLFQIKMASRVKEVVGRLEDIAKERFDFNLTQNTSDDNRVRMRMNDPIQTHSYIHESDVLGRDNDREKIVQLLTNASGKNGEDIVSVIPVLGMGGLGKTTLAKFVFNDARVKEYFDKTMWAYVSQNFNVADIVRAIIASATGGNCDLEFMEALQSRLRSILQGKKYLLVLDDVWNESQENWSELKTLLKFGNRGSKIIVTTRSKIVAFIVGTLPTYFLKQLEENDCWSLFIRCAFPARDEQMYPNLVVIGKEIVRRCGGVALAAKALGGLLMHYKTSESKWSSVRDDPIWSSDEDKIMSSLRLSYNHLPSHLKRCYSYCSLFPKGYRYSKVMLVNLWIAEGFIKKGGEHVQMEDVGNKYFFDLCQRSFLQYESSPSFTSLFTMNGERIFYSNQREDRSTMHDLIHDLAESVAGSESSMVVICKTLAATKTTRRLSLHSYNVKAWLDPTYFQDATKLRTFILPEGHSLHLKFETLDKMFCLGHLRILDLNGAREIKGLPDSIGKLVHLRYLDLSFTDIEMLPNSITSLRHLQTVKLEHCCCLRELPSDMSKMISLRQFVINFHRNIFAMPSNIQKLTYLQTLSFFIVGKDSGRGIHQLQSLNLRDKLTIRRLQNVPTSSEAKKSGLKLKKDLRFLHLCWDEEDHHSNVGMTRADPEHVIESLEPHANVTQLVIENYMGKKLPSWLMDSMVSYFNCICLVNCQKCDKLPPLSILGLLKVLIIIDMPELENWYSDVTRPLLSHVEVLRIKRCPKLTYLPQLPSLKTLELVECDELILRSVTNESCSLDHLIIGGFLKMTSFPPEGIFQHKSNLSCLQIRDCPVLKSFSKEFYEHHTTISELKIENCDEIESLMEGWRNLTSLTYLGIVRCRNLKSLPSEEFCGLSSLWLLHIEGCENLVSLDEGLQHLTSLKYLFVRDCSNLVALPQCTQKLEALTSLNLYNLPKLRSLHEIGGLTSLRRLIIQNCQGVEVLPDSLRDLTTLKDLEIKDCPCLQSRCTKNQGEDWGKVAHVPWVDI